MIPIGEHGLACLDGEDPAAIALSMQANADAIESALSGIDASLDSYLGRPYWSATNIGSISVSNSSGTVLPQGFVGADFQTDTTNGNIQANGFPVSQFFSSNFVFPEGIYFVGTSIKWTVATPNVNSTRTLMVTSVNRINGSCALSATSDELYLMTELEKAAPGGDGSLTASGFIKVDSNTCGINACFSHTNTSSALVIPTNGWRLWFIRMGSGLVI